MWIVKENSVDGQGKQCGLSGGKVGDLKGFVFPRSVSYGSEFLIKFQ